MTIGILGGGQLGRMLALAGYPLGLRLRFLDPAAEAPVKDLSELNVAPYGDYEALRRFAQDCDLITYEFENVPAESARFLSSMRAIYPPPKALDASQDRFAEKNFFQSLSIPTAKFARIDSKTDLEEALESVGLPAVLKTRRWGYDGKGQTIVREQSDLVQAWEALGRTSLILEEFIQFERELSMLAVRSHTGELAFYPLVENHHREGILRLSRAPAPQVSAQLQALAESYARKILEALNYVGVLALELFDVGALCAVPLLANEMAPRVHNSGHWTIEGAVTSQFENHLRAILGWPLGSIEPRGYCAMLNLIGRVPNSETVLKIPGAHLHLYGKSPRPGRKLGHITLCETSEELLEAKLAQLQALL